MIIRKITNSNDIKQDQTLLLIDNDNAIKGIDKVVSVDHKNDKYFYEAYATEKMKRQGFNTNNPYSIKLSSSVKQYRLYEVNETFGQQYSDECLEHATLSYDYGYTFNFLFNEDTGSVIWKLLMRCVYSNIETRMKFIDFTNKYPSQLHNLLFEDTRANVSVEDMALLKADIKALVSSLI